MLLERRAYKTAGSCPELPQTCQARGLPQEVGSSRHRERTLSPVLQRGFLLPMGFGLADLRKPFQSSVSGMQSLFQF